MSILQGEGSETMKSSEQKDLLGRMVMQIGSCGYVFFSECLKEHQVGRQACKRCKWKKEAKPEG
jgi:hypothetical protein